MESVNFYIGINREKIFLSSQKSVTRYAETYVSAFFGSVDLLLFKSSNIS